MGQTYVCNYNGKIEPYVVKLQGYHIILNENWFETPMGVLRPGKSLLSVVYIPKSRLS